MTTPLNGFERLITDGFLFESQGVRGFALRATYGDGYAEGAVIGHPEGLQTWKVKIAVLPDTDDYLVDATSVVAGGYGLLTRESYLRAFHLRHNVENAFLPFWFRDLKSGRDYLAEIVEEQLDYELLCLSASATAFTIRQRRVSGQSSPGDAAAVLNPQEI